MNDAAPMVVLDGLTRRFRDLVAVDSLSLTVQRGELFGLVGLRRHGPVHHQLRG